MEDGNKPGDKENLHIHIQRKENRKRRRKRRKRRKEERDTPLSTSGGIGLHVLATVWLKLDFGDEEMAEWLGTHPCSVAHNYL